MQRIVIRLSSRYSDLAILNDANVLEAATNYIKPNLLSSQSSQPCCLANVRVPPPGSEFAHDSAAYLAQLVGEGRPLIATVASRERPATTGRDKHPHRAMPKLHLVLREPGAEASVNEEMLRAGEGRLHG